ncbi:hypothetical protein ACLB1T_00630 [Escherichia coli]
MPRKKSRLGQIAQGGSARILSSAFIVSPVAMLVYGIVMKSGLNEILFYMVFTLPVIRYFLLEFLDNRSSMKRSEKLKKYVEKELSGIRVSGRAEEEQLGYTLRNIQDGYVYLPSLTSARSQRYSADNEAQK